MNRYTYACLCICSLVLVSFQTILTKEFFKRPPSIFPTLQEVTTYAKSLDEYPEIDNEDWENPNYSSVHTHMLPSLWSSWMNRLGLKKMRWDVWDFKKLLLAVVQEREGSGLMGRYVQVLKTEPGMKFVIFGDLHGAFHSLVRDLQKLKKMDIIDENFVIKNSNVYLVFNGNVATRAPYLLETLTLVLRLMYKNPKQVIFIRGVQEDKESWLHYGLKSELIIRAKGTTPEKVPLSGTINRFFITLPLALYLVSNVTDKSVEVVRISGYGRESKEFDENAFADELAVPDIQIIKLDELTKKKPVHAIRMKAIIRGEQFYKIQYQPSQGIMMSGKEEGATGWSVLSSPTSAYRALFNFFYDAFVILKITSEQPDKWIVSLYNQDVREQTGIKKRKVMGLVSGLDIPDEEIKKREIEMIKADVSSLKKKVEKEQQELTKLEGKKVQEVSQEVVTPTKAPAAPVTVVQQPVAPVPEKPQQEQKMLQVGASLALTGKQQSIGAAVMRGMKSAINAVNAGGVRNVQIHLNEFDDAYSAEKAKANIAQMIDKLHVDMLLCPLGGQTFDGYVDFIKSGKLAVFFPISGLPCFRSADLKNVINFRPSLAQEATALLYHIIEKMPAKKKIAIIYESEAAGDMFKPFLQSTVKEIAWLPVSYNRNDSEFSKQVNILKNEKPDVLLLFAAPAAALEMLRSLGTSWVSDKQLLCTSSLNIQAFKKFIADNNFKYILSSVVPDPNNTQLRICQDFRQAMGKDELANDLGCFEGFINLSLFAELAGKVDGAITKEKIISVAENLHQFNFKGIMLDFDVARRQLSNTVWLNTGTGEWNSVALTDNQVKDFFIGKAKEAPAAGVPEQKGAAEEKKAESIQSEQQEEIQLISTMDFSRNLKRFSNSVRAGYELAFDFINAEGGVHGRKIIVDPVDDEYTPEKTAKIIENFIAKNKLAVNFNPLGTPTALSYMPLIKEGKVLVVFPVTGSSALRDPAIPYFMHLRASYDCEGGALAKYALETLKAKKIALFYQNDVPSTAGVMEVFQAANPPFTNYINVVYERQSVSLDKQVQLITKENPDTIIFLSIPTVTIEFIRQISVDYLLGRKLLGWSDLATGGFQKDLKLKGLPFIISNVFPNPLTSSLPIAKEYCKCADERNAQKTVDGFEGFINAKVFTEILKKIQGPITREAIIKVFEGLKNFNYGGINLNFNPQTRSLLSTVWLDLGEGDWIPADCSVAKTEKTAPVSEEKKAETTVKVPEKASEAPVASVTEKKPEAPAGKKIDEKATEPEKKEGTQEIRVGTIVDLSKGERFLGIPIKSVLEAFFAKENVPGKVIQFNVLDDEYDPSKTKKMVQKMISELNTRILLFPQGSPTLASYFDRVKKDELIVLFPKAESPLTRDPSAKSIIHFGPSAKQIGYDMVKMLAPDLKEKKIAIFYQTTAPDIPDGVRAALKELNYKNFFEIGCDPAVVSFSKHVEELKKGDPEYIFLMAAHTATLAFLRQTGPEYFIGKKLVSCIPYMNTKNFKTFLRSNDLKCMLPSLVPNPNESDLAIVKSFRQFAQANNIDIEPVALEAFISAHLFTEALGKIDGQVKNEKIIAFFEALKDYSLEGWLCTFDPVWRSLSPYFWIDKGEGEWQRVQASQKQ